MADVWVGMQPIATGCSKILFIPRLGVRKAMTATLALGVATVLQRCHGRQAQMGKEMLNLC
jgi:hypothetical protein